MSCLRPPQRSTEQGPAGRTPPPRRGAGGAGCPFPCGRALFPVGRYAEIESLPYESFRRGPLGGVLIGRAPPLARGPAGQVCGPRDGNPPAGRACPWREDGGRPFPGKSVAANRAARGVLVGEGPSPGGAGVRAEGRARGPRGGPRLGPGAGRVVTLLPPPLRSFCGGRSGAGSGPAAARRPGPRTARCCRPASGTASSAAESCLGRHR